MTWNRDADDRGGEEEEEEEQERREDGHYESLQFQIATDIDSDGLKCLQYRLRIQIRQKWENYKQNCCQQRCKNFSYVIIFVSSALIPLNFKQIFIRQL